MMLTIKNAGGPYWNKGKQCYWIELHDGTTHKFSIDPDAGSDEIARTKSILGVGDPPKTPTPAVSEVDPLPPIRWL